MVETMSRDLFSIPVLKRRDSESFLEQEMEVPCIGESGSISYLIYSVFRVLGNYSERMIETFSVDLGGETDISSDVLEHSSEPVLADPEQFQNVCPRNSLVQV